MRIRPSILAMSLAGAIAAAPAVGEEMGALATPGTPHDAPASDGVASRGLGHGGSAADWTGFYAGASLGFGRASWRRSSASSGIGNLFAAYMADMGDYVIGADVTFAPAAAFGSFTTANEELRAAYAIYGRIGMTVDEEGRTLASVGLGPSWVRTRDDDGDTRTSAGVAAGVGLDHLLDDSWMVRSGVTFSRYGSVGARGDRVNTISAHVGAAFRF